MMTPLHNYHSLFELMLHEDELGRRFDLNEVRCEIDELDGHATFVAASPEFAIALFFPGWYVGDTSITPVHCAVKGDLPALFNWLPTPLEDKQNIIRNLMIGKEAQVLTLLSV